MKKVNPKLSQDQSATYEIRVPGRLDESWSDWFGEMAITTESGDDIPTITSLTGTVIDQAALQGLMDRLFALGLPILSVTFLDSDSEHIVN